MIPLLAGVSADEIRGPLSGLNALSGDSDAQLHQLLADSAKQLGILVQRPDSYHAQLVAVKAKASEVKAIAQPSSQAVVAPVVNEGFSVSMTVIGTPPEPQALRVRSGKPVTPIRLEYLLSSGVCLAADELNVEGGEAFDVPIHDSQVVKLWNTGRPDRNAWDGSGPAQLRLRLADGHGESSFTVPVQMELHGISARKLVGSQSFTWRHRA